MDREKLRGPFVQSLRLSMGLTQHDISDEVGFSIQTISKFENGKSNPAAYASKQIYAYVIYLACEQGHDIDAEFDGFCHIMELI